MIRTFRHKGLKDLFERGKARGIELIYIERCRQILAVLHAAARIEQINLPSYMLHSLEPSRPSTWSVRVSTLVPLSRRPCPGPWRITFGFRDGGAYAIDFEEYRLEQAR
jgi:proteic killer suppression protein